MTGATLSIAIAACILILILKPARALVVYLAVILYYPTFLVVSVGTVDVTAHRIVASVLLLKCLTKVDLLRKFNWCRLDTWVTVYIFVCTMMTFLTSPFEQALVNRGGSIIDTWFLYLIVRFCIQDRAGVLVVARWAAMLLAPLAVWGVVEAYTGNQLFAGLASNAPWGSSERFTNARFGLTRAIGTCGHPIVFGMCFTMLLPLVYYLRHEKRWRIAAYVLSGLALLGVLSSMSSGPWVMAGAMIFCLAMEKHKPLVRPALIFLALSCIFVGVASNRPFYHVIASYANPLGGSGWHRAKLIDLAIEHFGEWYLLGYGGRDPGWGMDLGSGHTDICNQFVLMGVTYGLGGLIVFCLMLTSAVRRTVSLHNFSKDPMVKSFAWSMGSILVSTIAAFFSISLMGRIIFLFYFVLGMIGSLSNVIGTTAQGNNGLPPQVMSIQT